MISGRRLMVLLGLLVVLVLTVLTSSCSKRVESTRTTLRDVRVRLDWTPWAPHAAFYAAQQLYYQEQGLNVKLYVPPDPEATAKLVAAGQDDFGVSYMTDTLLAREQGFKIVSIAALVPHPLNCIMTLKSSGLDKPNKLKNKTIGTTGVPSDEAFLAGVLLRNGVKKGEYKLVNIGFNLSQALKAGQVNAIVGAYYLWEGVKMQQDGFPVYVMHLQEWGVPDYYELVLITREELAAKEPSLLRRFLDATVKGQLFVQQNPEKAVELLRAASPELGKEFLSKSFEELRRTMKFEQGIFRQDDRTWSDLAQFMGTSGLLKTPSAASAGAFTNEYLPAEKH